MLGLQGQRGTTPGTAPGTGDRTTGAVRSLASASAGEGVGVPSVTLGLTKPSQPVVPQVKIETREEGPLEWSGDLLAVGVFQDSLARDDVGGKFADAELASLDEGLDGVLGELAADEEFKGKAGQATFVRLAGGKVRRVGLVGLGPKEGGLNAESSPGPWKALGSAVAAAAKQQQAKSAAVAVVGAPSLTAASRAAAAGAITHGVVLGSYEDTRFKSEIKKPTLSSLHLLSLGQGEDVENGIAVAVRVAAAVILTKQLVNSPPNVLTPVALAEVAINIAAAHADVMTCAVLEEEECVQLGMGAFLGVAAASSIPPKFIHLKYTPQGEVKKRLAIVGKGLTFDSGGYNLKVGPGSMIELMKFDMGGAGAALGAAKALGAIQPRGVEVHFLVAACENMISGKGMRPGDILTASNGKTIEVNNTDAEGRLTLADALVYACKLEVDAIVDLATLTGACIIALGNDVGGLFTPHDSMAEDLVQAAKAAGEQLWRMPMEEGYKEQLKSPVADMVNTGGRPGGSITAALFLKEFVDEKIPWAHLDIAGPVWNDKKGGATGFAVSTLVKWVQSYAQASE